MSLTAGIRDLVRRRADHRCEFCGIHENDAGGELTVDHYRPRAQGGSDDPENLIYACSRCNLYKHDYWPATPDAARLWNPREEPFAVHFAELSDGNLEARSATGAFTVRQLRLNRAQLVSYRRRKQEAVASRDQVDLYRSIVAVLGQLLVEQAAVADRQNELLSELRQLVERLLETRR